MAAAERRAKALAGKVRGSASTAKGLLDALREVGVKVTPRGAAVVVTMASRVLFAPGQTELRSEACEELVRVATVLLERFADRPVAVEGHTDSMPPKRTVAEFPTNWEISSARALAVLRCLVERGGLASERVHAVAYADTHPVADNGTPEGRAENRRVEIAVLPPIGTATVSAAFE
jgi:chemotaxis protein MotB